MKDPARIENPSPKGGAGLSGLPIDDRRAAVLLHRPEGRGEPCANAVRRAEARHRIAPGRPLRTGADLASVAGDFYPVPSALNRATRP